MKASKIYIDTRLIAEKLGVEPNQIAIGNIEGTHSEVGFMVFIDEDAEVKENQDIVSQLVHGVELRKSNLLRQTDQEVLKNELQIREMLYTFFRQMDFYDLVKTWDSANFTVETMLGSLLAEVENRLGLTSKTTVIENHFNVNDDLDIEKIADEISSYLKKATDRRGSR